MTKRIQIPGQNRPQLVLPPGVKRSAPRVALGYPFGSGVTGFFLQSLLGLQEYELARMARGEERYVRHLLPQSGLYIDHNRNRIVEKFLTTDAEWLVQIDSDIEFPPTIVETLLEKAGRDRKIVAASVPLGPPLPSCAWMQTEQPGVWEGLPATRVTAEGIAVDGLATAVILVHREVFERIADREGQCWFFKVLQPRGTGKSAMAWMDQGPMRDREYISVGEDLAFCMRAKDAGYQSFCVKIPGLRHHKTLPLSHDFEREDVNEPPKAQEAAAQ